MTTNRSYFAIPDCLVIDKEKASDTYCVFHAEPLEKGYGHTLGNTFRRILLSSLEGVAVTSIHIRGAPHEFSIIPDVVEDVTDIVLNVKQILFDCSGDLPCKLELHVNKKGPITASDITLDEATKIFNPEQLICTLDKKKELLIDIEIDKGHGYRLGEENRRHDQVIGVIPIDSLFSPVKRVAYNVHDFRVGQRTDYDKLVLEVWTDGRVHPENAVKQAAKILLDHLKVFLNINEDEKHVILINPEESELLNKLLRNVTELNLSVRAQNCLNNADIQTIGQLVSYQDDEILKNRNFGNKSLTELKEKLAQINMQLGMEIKESVKLAYEKEIEKLNQLT